MNTTVARPGHMVPGWTVQGIKPMAAIIEREEKAERGLTFAAGVFLALSITSAALASGMTVKGWQEATALHVVTMEPMRGHVL